MTAAPERRWLQPAEQQAATDAEQLILFATAAEEAGYPELAWRSRAVARTLLTTLQQLEAERSSRQALQQQRDRLLAIVGQAAYKTVITDHDRAWLETYEGFQG